MVNITEKIENMSAGQLAYETRQAERKGYSSLDSWLEEKLITIPVSYTHLTLPTTD